MPHEPLDRWLGMSLTIDRTHSSPNQSDRHGSAIRMLVIHATVGTYASSIAWLCSVASRVSSHYLISKSGHIAQLVPDDRAAWHAGKSAWKGLDSQQIEDGSIGIELENLTGMQGFQGQDPYPEAQVAALRALAREKIAQYHITLDMVVRHLDIAIPPGRKTDPAGFPWGAWKLSLAAEAGLYVARHTQAIFESPTPDGRIALDDAAELTEGQRIDIDEVKRGWAHLTSGVGFVPVGVLTRVG